jgi:hypothetical protein
MRMDKNNGAVFMKLFLVPALFLAGLLISIPTKELLVMSFDL